MNFWRILRDRQLDQRFFDRMLYKRSNDKSALITSLLRSRSDCYTAPTHITGRQLMSINQNFRQNTLQCNVGNVYLIFTQFTSWTQPRLQPPGRICLGPTAIYVRTDTNSTIQLTIIRFTVLSRVYQFSRPSSAIGCCTCSAKAALDHRCPCTNTLRGENLQNTIGMFFVFLDNFAPPSYQRIK